MFLSIQALILSKYSTIIIFNAINFIKKTTLIHLRPKSLGLMSSLDIQFLGRHHLKGV